MTSSEKSQRTSAYRTQLREAMRKHFPAKGLPLIRDDRRVRWTPRLLATAATLTAWHSAPTLREAFAAARENVAAMYPTRRRPGKHLEGFLKTLQKQSHTLLATVTASLRDSSRRLAGRRWRRGGRVVLSVDGSRVNCPRTEANEAALGCAGRRKTGPQLQLTTLYHMASGLPWSWRRGGGKTAERNHLREMIGELPERTLLLADAGFTGYELMRELIRGGHSFVIRAGSNVTLLRKLGCAVEAGGERVYLWPKKHRRTPPLSLRMIQVRSKGKRMALLTNLSAAELSRKDATRLYKSRWEVEVMFRSLKQTMEKRTLRGATPHTAALELDWAMIGLWMLGLMTVAACGLNEPWSVAKAQSAVRAAMRRPDHRVRRHALRNQLKDSVRDSYVRKGSKQSRDWPRKKKQRPPGTPKMRTATKQEVAAAKRFTDQREAG